MPLPMIWLKARAELISLPVPRPATSDSPAAPFGALAAISLCGFARTASLCSHLRRLLLQAVCDCDSLGSSIGGVLKPPLAIDPQIECRRPRTLTVVEEVIVVVVVVAVVVAVVVVVMVVKSMAC